MSDAAAVRERLLALIAKMTPEPPQYVSNADIVEDFGLDSLDQIEFLFNVEEAFAVKIDDETFEEQGLRNFDNLVNYIVDRKVAASL